MEHEALFILIAADKGLSMASLNDLIVALRESLILNRQELVVQYFEELFDTQDLGEYDKERIRKAVNSILIEFDNQLFKWASGAAERLAELDPFWAEHVTQSKVEDSSGEAERLRSLKALYDKNSMDELIDQFLEELGE